MPATLAWSSGQDFDRTTGGLADGFPVFHGRDEGVGTEKIQSDTDQPLGG